MTNWNWKLCWSMEVVYVPRLKPYEVKSLILVKEQRLMLG